MLFSLTLLTALSSVVNAVPFKRYDNETIDAVSIAHQSTVNFDSALSAAFYPSSSIAQSDLTTTVTQYVTKTVSGSVITIPVSTYVATVSSPVVKNSGSTSATSSIVQKTVTEFVTLTINGHVTTSAISTFTTSVPDVITTSTTTHYITVTKSDTTSVSSAESSNDACVCIPSTTTVTVTASSTSSSGNEITTVTGTKVTSFPVIGEFSVSGSTTKVTSYVEITLTESSYVTTPTPVFTNFSNSTVASSNARRQFFDYV